MPNVTGIPVAPLTGVMDARSTPDRMAPNALRYRQNLRTAGEGKLRRGDGFKRLLAVEPYGDMDFHDQLEVFTPGVGRQPVTLLFEASSSRETRALIAGTQGKIAKLNEHGGNWQILGSGYGGTQSQKASAPRFKCDQVGDYLVFTNDFDKPMYYVMEDVSVDGGDLLQSFADLDLIGLTRAAVVVVWNNVVFLANVTMDATHFGYRIVWGNYLDPTSFDPAKQNSIAGSFDLKTYETVLAAKATQSSLLWYTTHGIWEMAAVGGEVTYQFVRRYNGEDNKGAGVLKYPNTLVGQPDAHFYGAEDGLYVYSPYYVKPDRLDWLHRATPVLGYNEPGESGAFGNVDANNCRAHIAIASRTQALLSFAREGAANDCPDVTLRVNLQYRTVDVIDEGFTAFCNYRSFSAPTVRDFIIENQICTLAELAAQGFGYHNENVASPAPAASSAFAPTVFYTDTTQDVGVGVTMENWNEASASADSLCALLGTMRIEDLCVKCSGPTLLVGASSRDWCLKELGGVFYKEICSNPSDSGASGGDGYVAASGSYGVEGIRSVLRFAPLFGPEGAMRRPMTKLERFMISAIAEGQETPALLRLKVGISGTVCDANRDDGRIVQFEHGSKAFKYLSGKSAAAHIAANTIPVSALEWNFYRKGRFLYVELVIDGMGGDGELSEAMATAGLEIADKY